MLTYQILVEIMVVTNHNILAVTTLFIRLYFGVQQLSNVTKRNVYL